MAFPDDSPSKLYLLAALLCKDGVITRNGRALFKELIVRRDPRLERLMTDFQSSAKDATFVDAVHALVEAEARASVSPRRA